MVRNGKRLLMIPRSSFSVMSLVFGSAVETIVARPVRPVVSEKNRAIVATSF